MANNVVYLIQYFWYNDYRLLAIYDNKEAVIAHLSDLNFIKEYKDSKGEICNSIVVEEIGVRSKKQLKEVSSRNITKEIQNETH